MRERVTICEVAPRDGLQNEATPVATDRKGETRSTSTAASRATAEIQPGLFDAAEAKDPEFADTRIAAAPLTKSHSAPTPAAAAQDTIPSGYTPVGRICPNVSATAP